eukprot:gb/GECH01014831.1/.p1 GENE.gb/GECH01014831.1/~~gb/GECH01014831.1/.p1  ORF type:complete len:498 (+),score=107.92 gb/GECH01014831.1/:1-1494(+)
MQIEQVLRDNDIPYLWQMFHMYLRWELDDILKFAERKEVEWQIDTSQFIEEFCSYHPRELTYSNDVLVKHLLLSLTRAYVYYNMDTEVQWTSQFVKQIPKIESSVACDVSAVMSLVLFYFIMHGKAEEYAPLRQWLQDEVLWRIRITSSTDPYVLFCCAVTLSYSGDHKAGFKMSEALLETRNDQYTDLAQFLAARNCEEIGLHQESLDRYIRVVQVNDELVLALNNLGNAYSRSNILDKTFEAYQRAIQCNNKYSTVFYNLANLYYKCECFQEAIENYTHAINLRRIFPDALNNRGNCYCFRGSYSLALHDYNAVIEHNQSSHAYYSRALLYSDCCEGVKAAQDFINCLKQELRHGIIECAIDVIICLYNQSSVSGLTEEIDFSRVLKDYDNLSNEKMIQILIREYDIDQSGAQAYVEIYKSRKMFETLVSEFAKRGGLELIIELMDQFPQQPRLVDAGQRLLQKHMNEQDIRLAQNLLQNRQYRGEVFHMFNEHF